MKSSQSPNKYLMMVVVQEQDINHAISAAVELGVMVIHLVSTGGFLGNRSGTLLIGVPEDLEQNLIDALQKACKQRLEYINMPVEGAPMPLPTPVPVTVGGATIFAMPVEHFEEI